MSDEILMYVAAGMVAVIGGIFLYVTAKYPSKVREWLLWAVTTAEKEYGSGTGQIKLRAVYDLFLAKFPKLSIFVSFDIPYLRMKHSINSSKHLEHIDFIYSFSLFSYANFENEAKYLEACVL